MTETTCPHCRADQRGEPIPPEARRERPGCGTRYLRTIAVQVRGVYDGALFSCCPFCFGTWHRWDPVTDGRRYEAAERHRHSFTDYMKSRRDQRATGYTRTAHIGATDP